MTSAGKSAVAPLYLLACLILGGSEQTIWQNALLQLAGIAILAWSAAAPRQAPLGKDERLLLLLFAAAIAIVALQLLPLPPSLWEHGVRARLADGDRLLGRPIAWHPVSLTPYGSLASLLKIIPPLALYCAIVRLRPCRPMWLVGALVAGTIAATVLAAVQLAAGAENSILSPDRRTGLGLALGFFAEPGQMADLVIICLPFVAALAADRPGEDASRRVIRFLVLCAIALVLVGAIVLNGSVAAYVLALPVIAASASILFSPGSLARRVTIILGVLCAAIAMGILATGSLATATTSRHSATAAPAREAIVRTTGKIVTDNLPFGSGLGSFAQVSQLYENPDLAGDESILHAGGDYAEVAVELGIGGMLLMVFFLAWWLKSVVTLWRSESGGGFALAASIASAAILLDGLADFPLHRAAISACLALCLALLAGPRRRLPLELAPLRPARHLVYS